MSCASRHYRGHTRKRERGGGEQRFGFDVTLEEQSLHSMLLCHRCSRSINSRCSYYPPPIETFARANIAPLPLSLHYHRCHTTTVTVSLLCCFECRWYLLSSISHGLKKQYGADRLEIPRFYFWRGSLVFLLYKLTRINAVNTDKFKQDIKSCIINEISLDYTSNVVV